ncbi:EVE domain-containing protein [Candidatus Bathyarchaeota archaeon]|nr:EVE domain-containing protein [Candidatus Bathyarchaeota archaeon]
MRCWIFQFNPDKFRWFDWIKENKDAEQWLVTRHMLDIRKGDKAAIWASERDAGIYALSEVITIQRMNPSTRKKKNISKKNHIKLGFYNIKAFGLNTLRYLSKTH